MLLPYETRFRTEPISERLSGHLERYPETTQTLFSNTEPLLNRKFHTVKNWYQFFTSREKLVPIRHIFHTNISHFVKFAHVVKLYVDLAYMRNLHIDFAFDSNSSHICQDFIMWFKQVTDKFHM